mmetsp:Transcript_23173/g.34320  ORF Transcript_23173/g.34320 Transcript_23173/m.34320 type:complete len:94 (-) Transcript_23173:260-541(-)
MHLSFLKQHQPALSRALCSLEIQLQKFKITLFVEQGYPDSTLKLSVQKTASARTLSGDAIAGIAAASVLSLLIAGFISVKMCSNRKGVDEGAY